MGSLQGKVAFITGAARGQGRAEAVRLASDGADIIAVDICDQIASVPYPMATPDDLAPTVKLVEDTGARIVAREADVRDRDSLSTALRAGMDEFGRLDIVIANAGIAPMQSGEAGWRDVIDVNLTGVYHTVDVAIPTDGRAGRRRSDRADQFGGGPGRYRRRRRGLAGLHGGQARIVGLMRAYANLLAQHRHPGEFDPSGRGEHADDRQRVHRQWLDRVMREAVRRPDFGNALPVQAVEAEDIAAAVAWLVSDEACYVTGVTLPVDAGDGTNADGAKPRRPDRLRTDGAGGSRAVRAAANAVWSTTTWPHRSCPPPARRGAR